MIQFVSFTEVVAKIEEGLGHKGFTVADLCRKAGIAQTTWGRWKGGKFEPRDKTKEAVIGAYNAMIEGAESEGATQ